MIKEIICEECGKLFIPKRKWQKFCSSTCRHKNWFERTFIKKENTDND